MIRSFSKPLVAASVALSLAGCAVYATPSGYTYQQTQCPPDLTPPPSSPQATPTCYVAKPNYDYAYYPAYSYYPAYAYGYPVYGTYPYPYGSFWFRGHW